MKIEIDLKEIDDDDMEYSCSLKSTIRDEIGKALVLEIRRMMNEELRKKQQILQALIRDACDKIQYPNPQDIVDQFISNENKR